MPLQENNGEKYSQRYALHYFKVFLGVCVLHDHTGLKLQCSTGHPSRKIADIPDFYNNG
jgi:hypothetical protein